MDDTITVEQLTSKLSMLDVARQRLLKSEDDLEQAESLYCYAIGVLEQAMEDDEAVTECREAVADYKDIYSELRGDAEDVAIDAWEDGETDGKKQWCQDDWEVRVRTTRTPKVEDIPKFLYHVSATGAYSIVKSVTLNKKDAADLAETLEDGVSGMEVVVRDSCSLRRV